ncbi:hypothetical protein B0H12DRAFT_1100456 [Mycena haematopus]|nr:hypothetical protein B0H12DRAFT_1100456 [Mycena haematopus]
MGGNKFFLGRFHLILRQGMRRYDELHPCLRRTPFQLAEHKVCLSFYYGVAGAFEPGCHLGTEDIVYLCVEFKNQNPRQLEVFLNSRE